MAIFMINQGRKVFTLVFDSKSVETKLGYFFKFTHLLVSEIMNLVPKLSRFMTWWEKPPLVKMWPLYKL